MYSQAVVAVIAEVDAAAAGVDAVAGVAAVVLSNAIDVALLGGGYLLHYVGY